jgi:phosphoribosyl 1,2-cyclic phosphodiesterase
MRICVLRSGSSGNCLLIENGTSRILIDAGGMSQRKLREILLEAELTPDQLDGIVITHTHSDHINYSTIQTCRKYTIPIWIHRINIPFLINQYQLNNEDHRFIPFNMESFEISGFCIEPFEVSHDAPEVTCGFRISEKSSGKVFTYAADLGCFPDSLLPFFKGASVIFLEANHDTELLWKNPQRPYVHKKRVAGNNGHLSNIQCAEAIVKIIGDSGKLPQKLVLCHLSKDHNSPQLAIDTVAKILEKEKISVPVVAASRYERSDYFEI